MQALHLAARAGSLSAVHELLKAGADPLTASASGYTATALSEKFPPVHQLLYEVSRALANAAVSKEPCHCGGLEQKVRPRRRRVWRGTAGHECLRTRCTLRWHALIALECP